MLHREFKDGWIKSSSSSITPKSDCHNWLWWCRLAIKPAASRQFLQATLLQAILLLCGGSDWEAAANGLKRTTNTMRVQPYEMAGCCLTVGLQNWIQILGRRERRNLVSTLVSTPRGMSRHVLRIMLWAAWLPTSDNGLEASDTRILQSNTD